MHERTRRQPSSRAIPLDSCTMPCTSPRFLHDAVHFPRILASTRTRARKQAKCTPECRKMAEVHAETGIRRAFRRALPSNPCTKLCPCKESGEVHGWLQEKTGSARLGFGGLQEKQGSARRPAKKWRKCARPLASGPSRTFPHHPCTWKISCSNSGEMYVELQG